MESIISGVTSELLGKALDVCVSTGRVLSNNVANAGSTGFRASKVDFDALFESTRDAVVEGDVGEIRSAVRSVDTQTLPVMPQQDETVSLDQSMVELTENTLRYHALVDMRKGLSSLMKIAIMGSKR